MFQLNYIILTIHSYHRASLVRWSLHKYKCLWGVGNKGWDLSFQKEALHMYTLRLHSSRIFILYKNKKKIKTIYSYLIRKKYICTLIPTFSLQ